MRSGDFIFNPGSDPVLTDGFDDGILQRFLVKRRGFVFSGIVIVTSQLVVDALPELPQQRVEHLQHGGTCSTEQKTVRWENPVRSGPVLVLVPAHLRIQWLRSQLPQTEPPRSRPGRTPDSCCWRPGDPAAAG